MCFFSFISEEYQVKKLTLGLSVLAISAASTAFATPTGTITFTGTLVDGTCAATVGGGSSASGSFALPTMNIASLTATNAVAGDTPFIIKLSGVGCTAGSKIATPYFEAEPAKVNAAGRLINTTTPDTDAAKNIDIQILTSDKTVIDLNEPANTQTTTVGVDNGTNIKDFKYFARYFATAAAEKGDVEASVSYSIFYK